MITKTVGTWTITGDDKYNLLGGGPRIIATDGTITVDVDVQYRQITSTTHTALCDLSGPGVGMRRCTCTPALPDADALIDACREVMRACSAAWTAAEAAAQAARQDAAVATDVYVRVAPGCDCPSALHGGPCTCCC